MSRYLMKAISWATFTGIGLMFFVALFAGYNVVTGVDWARFPLQCFLQ